MAQERFIIGKHDTGHHEGKRSERRRIDEAMEELKEFGALEQDKETRVLTDNKILIYSISVPTVSHP